MNLKVSDIKQFFYCPRILYFTYVCPVDKKVTRKMDYGKEEHLELDRLEKRRTFRRYHLEQGERRFHTRLYSARLGLEGMLDMHIVSNGEAIPVEFKYSAQEPSLNHKYQLIAYAMLLEDTYHKPVRHGFLYFTPGNRIYIVEITPNGREFVKETLNKIRHMISSETFPKPPYGKGKCIDCEFRNYCRDRR